MIHQYKLNGYNIVIDVASGSIHVVDEPVYDIISMYENYSTQEIVSKITNDYPCSEEEVIDCLNDIKGLIDEEKLFCEEDYANVAVDFKYKNNVTKALCLHVAHTCNLNCSYCFAAGGKYKGKDALMSLEVGKKAIDFLIENSGTRTNLEVDFFGGEPLMNWQVVKDIVNYARSIEKEKNKNFRFTLTTNGVLINDEVIEFSNREMDNVVLSLDGRKKVHDYFRIDLNSVGSYEKILPKFKKFVETRGDKGYYMRGTFTHNNVDFTNDIFHMADLGFTQLSMEPVVCHEDDPYALTKEDLPILFEQYEVLAKEMLKRENEGKGFEFYHYMIDLNHGPCIYKRVTGCGSGSEYFAVTPTGDLYPCHQFVGEPKYLMGNVFNGVNAFDLQDEFKSCNVYSRQECRECWARLYCSGGCAANSYHATGDIKGIYSYGCELFKKRMECAIMLQIARQM